MTWQPQDEPLRQLAGFLFDSLQYKDLTAQKNAELMLKNAKSSPDFTNYLALLFSSSQVPSSISLSPADFNVSRSAAAIMLKNTVKTSYKSIPEPNRAYLRSVVVRSLQDDSAQIRSYAGNVITELVKQGGLMAWPHLLSELIAIVENKDKSAPSQTQEGAMSALLKICEDNRKALDRDYHGERPLNFVFTKLMEFTQSSFPKIRADALAAINVFLPEFPPVAQQNLDQLLQLLFQLATDSSTVVRKHVCRALTHLAELAPQAIIPHISGLVDYTVAQQRNEEDAELALDAAEFWLCIGESEKTVDALGPYLPKIVPCLLDSMVYSEDDILRLEGERDDAEEEDREQDIKPAFATGKGARNTTAVANGDAPSQKTDVAQMTEEDDLSEGEIEELDDDDDGGDPEEQWNLRKCSAAALDVLSTRFHDIIFQDTLPYLLKHLSDAEWPQQEAAVLALGAIADGCMQSVQPHLPELTPYLLSLLSSKEPVVRQITCWTLGRYSEWAAHLPDEGRRQFFEPIMDGILQRMLDRNKKVQEAAASAFATLEDKAGVVLIPYAEIIIQQFVNCFHQYKDKNMFILYDCIQTLAEHVGSHLQKPELGGKLMPALIQRWQRVSDQSREMFLLFECLSYVATALSEGFTPFAEPIFTRCIRIIHTNLEDTVRAANNPAMDKPDSDFLVTSLDLLSAIIQALAPATSAQLVAKSQPNMFELLAYCMNNDHNDVRQSAYALLGDCSIYIYPQLQPYLNSIMELILAQLEVGQINYDSEETGAAVINNACWSLGEIAVREKAGMAPYIDKILEKLANILFASNTPQSLLENVVIAIGRLGMGCADQLSPHLSHIAPAFLNAISTVMWTDEKGHALIGFNKIVLGNPTAMADVLFDYFGEIASAPALFFNGPEGEERRESCKQVMVQYQAMIPNLDAHLQQLPPDKLQALRTNLRL